ncbi:XapX domain-containing protein [Streptomyces sp. NPDC057621]|uniref:XapX domain-containing protein n=1 Tax=Streptomyces sp. NPDC057621 TaxID=3346186 RepID=UPI0036AC2D63
MNTPKAVPKDARTGVPEDVPTAVPKGAPETAPRAAPSVVRAGHFTRHAALAFVAGALMGAVYWALSVPSPAPPLLGLTGLAGIVAGERIVTAVRDRRSRRRLDPHLPGAHS